jgi:hypothetical protein
MSSIFISAFGQTPQFAVAQNTILAGVLKTFRQKMGKIRLEILFLLFGLVLGANGNEAALRIINTNPFALC